METDGDTAGKLNAPSAAAVVEPAGAQSVAPAGRASSESAAPASGSVPVLIVPFTVADPWIHDHGGRDASR